jgi:4-hydroxybenzoate polyprenyltransferase
MIRAAFGRVRRFLELIRFSHTIFALPFAMLSAVLAWRTVPFRWRDLGGILLCMVFARSASMAFNRIVDRQIDAQNPRTSARHLPAGLLSLRIVAIFTVACAAGFVASTLLFLPNQLPLLLSVPVLAFLCGYSYAKRWTAFSHYWLGAALMLSPIAAWIALAGNIAWPPVLLGLAVFFWVGGFDIIYACQDVDFDRSHRLWSVPARFGVTRALRLAAFSHLLTVACLLGLWWSAHLGPLFMASVIAVGVLLAYEHRLVRPDNLTRINVAFFNVNAVISIGLFLVGVLDVWMARW